MDVGKGDGFQWWDLPENCPHCGRPLEAADGQTIIATVKMELVPGGGVKVDPESQAFWCGKCVQGWNQRMAPNG